MTNVSKLPDDESGKMDYNEFFKSKVGVNIVAAVPQRQGWIRKGVITNYPASSGPTLVRNFENHLKMGWAIVYDTGAIQDDRKFSPNTNKQPNRIPAPLIGKTSDGYEYVVMEIEESKAKEYFTNKEKENHEKYLKSIGGKVSHRKGKDGDELHIREDDTKLG